ncbi:hypothetical protein UCRPC4_g05336 [Phaeomoniella chlamydospora]|uniref:Uncharacterized protein n=1 Tax=Phaeomoniella chlamydospora TaxID=158046 RepID=A0A0G2G181_PHACM|nr:hypothetical protein UCRPC4_g05336 [Phaeomoniella chlamydospora]
MLTRKRSQGETYRRLEDDEGDIADMPINVDISSLSGAGIEMSDVGDIDQPKMNYLEPSGEDERRSSDISKPTLQRLGKGMVIGAQLNVGPMTTTLDRSVSQSERESVRKTEVHRAKTIRERGQQAAQERQVIVAVNQAVDLSSYEGMDNADGSTLRPESSFLTSRRESDLTQSYYYPIDQNLPNWRPFSMRPYYIILLILISFALAGVQEWLCQLSLKLEKQNDAILKFDDVSQVSLWNFFCWKYLPTLIFVTYGVFWQIMDFDVRRLEPFYQLSLPDGSTAEQSLHMDYLSMMGFLVPLKAYRYRQWAVLFSSIGTLLAASLSASLQNPSVVFVQNPECTPKCKDDAVRYFVRIQPVWSRCLTTCLLLTGIIGMNLLIQLQRKSGLLSDPKGIAGIASMATKSHILNDFQGLDMADGRGIYERLQHRRYVLYKSSIWQGEYIQHSSTISEPQHDRNPLPIMLRLKTGWVFVGTLTVFLIIIPIINFTPARVIPNAAPWLPILIATIIKMTWSTLDFDVRMMEPFFILSRGNAPPQETLTLDYRGTPYGILPLKAFMNRHFLVALVSFGSILTDILTVIVSSFSVNGERFLKGPNDPMSLKDETSNSFWGSVILSILIVTILIFSAILVYWRRGHPFLPRQPNTIASVLAYIFASHMLFDFIDTELFTARRMEAMLKRNRKTYGLGWFSGFDNKVHVAVDQMPWKARFEFGRPADWIQPPWSMSNMDDQF